jgi:hypothetical protein
VSDHASAIETIERLRAMGARRIRVGDVEVEFFTAPQHEVPASEKPARLAPDERERQQRAADEDILFAASG